MKLLGKIKTASHDQNLLLYHVSSLLGLLSVIKFQAEDPDLSHSWTPTLESLKVPLHSTYVSLLEVERNLQNVVRQGGAIAKAFIWPFQREETKRVLAVIEKQQALFQLALQNDHL